MNRKLGRNKADREHTIRNLAASLVLYEAISTTEAKAKEVKRYLDRVIARAKVGTLSSERRVFGIFFDKNAALKLIKELLPRYSERNSGFIKSYHLKNRLGDNSSMMRLELVDRKTFVKDIVKDNKENVDGATTVIKKKGKASKTDEAS